MTNQIKPKIIPDSEHKPISDQEIEEFITSLKIRAKNNNPTILIKNRISDHYSGSFNQSHLSKTKTNQ